MFTAHLKIDELLSQNTKLQAQIGPKLEKNKINAPNFYNTISHFPKYKESNTFTNEKPKISGPVKKTNLNKSVTLFSNYEKSEKELKKNSDDIEKLKYELR